jgi:hypothetical protein
MGNLEKAASTDRLRWWRVFKTLEGNEPLMGIRQWAIL